MVDETKKMLKIIINGQSSFRQEVIGKIDKLDKKLTDKIDGVGKKLGQRMSKVENRLDKIGLQLAYLEDDAPTREEFGKLEKRVDELEAASAH